MAKHLTQEEFIARAVAAHGNRYDYSQAHYISKDLGVTILCSTHGLFTQRANDHMRGKGCIKCSGNHLHTADSFAILARAKHNDYYDYSSVVYKGAHHKVIIGCPAHGEFMQTPDSHNNQGGGCPQCAGVGRRNTASFIADSQAIHGNRYDYSRAEYVNNRCKTTILCSVHGEFQQTPKLHLKGCGCNKCGEALTGEKNSVNPAVVASARLSWLQQAKGRVATLYFLRIYNQQENFYKVGVTYLTVKKRFRGLMLPYSYETLALHQSTNPASVWDWEQSILETYAHLQYKPKQKFAGDGECFSSADEILVIFPL